MKTDHIELELTVHLNIKYEEIPDYERLALELADVVLERISKPHIISRHGLEAVAFGVTVNDLK